MRKVLLFLLPFAVFFLNVSSEVIEVKTKKGRRILINKAKKSSPSKYSKYKKLSGVSSSRHDYLARIKELSEKYQLREDLIVAVAKAESGLNPYAVSRKGAVGIMQLMHSTAKKYGVANRFNIDENLEAGVRHLRYLFHRYNNNIPMTLAAYNAGEDAVKRYRGIPPFRETRNYIKRVMKSMGLGYSTLFTLKKKTKIYRYKTADGRTVISDSLPANAKGKIEVIE